MCETNDSNIMYDSFPNAFHAIALHPLAENSIRKIAIVCTEIPLTIYMN